jgi:hypothetical protein
MGVKMKAKQLWRGVFTFGKIVERPLYRYAYTEKQAWKTMCDYLAKKHGVHPSWVYGMFDGTKKNYEISIELEFKEGENGIN